MARNMQIFHQRRKQATRIKIHVQQQNKEKRHTPILKGREIQPNQVTAIINLISTSTNKHMHNTNSRSKKNRECLVQLYEAIIPI